MITQDQLSAYLDGETTASEAREIDAALQADPELRVRLDRLERNDLNVKAAMDRLLERPVPDRLELAVRASLAARDPRPVNDNLARRALWPAAIAAALVAGVMIGNVAPLGAAGGADWTSGAGGGPPTAGKALAVALATTPSGGHVTLAAQRTMTPVMTFKSRGGSLCRQFDLKGAAGVQSGLACRADGDAWRLVALTTTATTPLAGGYQTASGPGDDAVSAMADRLIKGEPMDAAAEAAALRSR